MGDKDRTRCEYCKLHKPIDFCAKLNKTGYFNEHPACEHFEIDNEIVEWKKIKFEMKLGN